MNDDYKALKERIRRLDVVLASHGAGDRDFAQALSLLHRAVRKGDRSREPTPELRGLLERAETLARRNG